MKIALPRKVMMIIKNLQLHGYEAYAVGGCVRDFDPCAQTEGLGYYNFRAPGGSEEAFQADSRYGD